MNDYNEYELNQELKSWQINPNQNGFASSYKILYKTNFTTIAAKAFHIPNPKNGIIHHFDLSIRTFKRKKIKNNWEEKITTKENANGNHLQIEIKEGDGQAVKELTNFLLAQYEAIGQKIVSQKLVYDNSTNLNLNNLINSLTIKQIEELGSGFKIEILKEYKEFLISNLDKQENFIQNWIDEDNGKYRKQRCLIFGLEYIDFKREGEINSKRFDILTKTSINHSEYVIIELKSPCDDVFKTVEKSNKNQGKSTEYHLSNEISRAIPQILNYKSMLESKNADDEDLQRIGITNCKIAKCIILIGKRNNCPIWNKNFINLKSNLSSTLEIWTYSDLIDKLEITIKNLEENLI